MTLRSQEKFGVSEKDILNDRIIAPLREALRAAEHGTAGGASSSA